MKCKHIRTRNDAYLRNIFWAQFVDTSKQQSQYQKQYSVIQTDRTHNHGMPLKHSNERTNDSDLNVCKSEMHTVLVH